MTLILTVFFAHWVAAVFLQTFFLHRYASHGQFTMNKFTERFFQLLTMVVQGSSYLSPYGYAVLHRMHHAYSDTEKDPHSPHTTGNVFSMMWQTKQIYHGYNYREVEPEPQFKKDLVDWKILDIIGNSWAWRLFMGTAWALFYIAFVPAGQEYLYLLLPAHWMMGPIHGAIVNWCGHKYGYQNHKDTGDKSRNTLIFDFVTMGELFQNNHHADGNKSNFANRWFEVDPTYPIMLGLHYLGVIRLKSKMSEEELLALEEKSMAKAAAAQEKVLAGAAK